MPILSPLSEKQDAEAHPGKAAAGAASISIPHPQQGRDWTGRILGSCLWEKHVPCLCSPQIFLLSSLVSPSCVPGLPCTHRSQVHSSILAWDTLVPEHTKTWAHQRAK